MAGPDTTSSEDEGPFIKKRVTNNFITNVSGSYAQCAVGNKAQFHNNSESINNNSNSNDNDTRPATSDNNNNNNTSNEENSEATKLKVCDVLKDLKDFLIRFTEFRSQEKVLLEQFILQDLLPSIESHTYRTGSSCNDTLEVLSQLSCPSLNSPRVLKHSLAMLQTFVALEFGKESANAHVKAAECILRRPFVEGSFKGERIHEQRTRMSVYGNCLILVHLCQAKGYLTHPYSKDEKKEIMESVAETVRKHLLLDEYRKKDRLRYAMEMIIFAIQRLFAKKPLATQLQRFLGIVLGLLKDDFQENDVEDLLGKLREAEEGFFDLHVIMRVLKSMMTNNTKAFPLLLCIIKKQELYNKQFWKHTMEDWQFVLLACEMLVDIAKNHKKEGTRREAAECLVNFHGSKAFFKSRIIRAIIEKYLLKAAFCPDFLNRSLILQKRFNPDNQIPLPTDVLKRHICEVHRSSDLEVSSVLFEDDEQVVFRGLFLTKPSAIKVLIVKQVSQLYCEHAQERSPAEKAFQNEIEILRRLNSTKPSRHVLELFHSDVTNMPYYVITEFMPKENLQDFLRECREGKLPTYCDLLRMALGIVTGMIHISEKGIIHFQLRTENILVGENLTCKVSGFYSSRAFPNGVAADGIADTPIKPGNTCLRWTAPECLRDPAWFSIQSDVWAFGVLLYELFTYGSVPYFDKVNTEVLAYVLSGRHLPKESCISDGVYAVIQKCCTMDKDDRILFNAIFNYLQTLLSQMPEQQPVHPNLPPLRSPQEHDEDENGNNPNREEDPCVNYEIGMASRSRVPSDPEKVRLKIKKTNLENRNPQHLKNLRSLKHQHVVEILAGKRNKISINISCEHYKNSSLRDYILQEQCSVVDLTRFAAQSINAVHYLHSKDIVHCDLRASNFVVVNSRYVKLSGLGRSKTLEPSYMEEDSSSCVTHGEMPAETVRWSAPEVIQDGLYSQASDIWSLGMMLWEMFSCLHKDDLSARPFPLLQDDEVLSHLKKGERPHQPLICEDWMYVLMTQCWPHYPTERASPLAVMECLSNRCPWDSYILQLWLRKHEVHENWPNLNVTILEADKFLILPREEVEKSTTEECCADHNYEYQTPFRRIVSSLERVIRKIPFRLRLSSLSLPVDAEATATTDECGTFQERTDYEIYDIPRRCVNTGAESMEQEETGGNGEGEERGEVQQQEEGEEISGLKLRNRILRSISMDSCGSVYPCDSESSRDDESSTITSLDAMSCDSISTYREDGSKYLKENYGEFLPKDLESLYERIPSEDETRDPFERDDDDDDDDDTYDNVSLLDEAMHVQISQMVPFRREEASEKDANDEDERNTKYTECISNTRATDPTLYFREGSVKSSQGCEDTGRMFESSAVKLKAERRSSITSNASSATSTSSCSINDSSSISSTVDGMADYFRKSSSASCCSSRSSASAYSMSSSLFSVNTDHQLLRSNPLYFSNRVYESLPTNIEHSFDPYAAFYDTPSVKKAYELQEVEGPSDDAYDDIIRKNLNEDLEDTTSTQERSSKNTEDPYDDTVQESLNEPLQNHDSGDTTLTQERSCQSTEGYYDATVQDPSNERMQNQELENPYVNTAHETLYDSTRSFSNGSSPIAEGPYDDTGSRPKASWC